jgi:hypothetical protein
MSRIATARKLANEISDGANRLPRNAFDAFTTSNSIGWPLALGIIKGWITGISVEAIGHMEDTAGELRGLLALAALPQVDVTSAPVADLIEFTDSYGRRWVLVHAAQGIADTPVSINDTIRTEYDPAESFVVTDSVRRDDIDETARCVIGRWVSDGSSATEVYPLSICGFQVEWVLQPN